MVMIPRWLASVVLAAGLGLGAMTPVPAHADDELTRVLVDVADVIFNGGVPYYRYGDHRYDDRLIVGRDRYGRRVYYRVLPHDGYYRTSYRGMPPYGNAYGYYRGPASRGMTCNRHGKCKAEYYDPRHDRGGHGRDDGDGRGWNGRRWHDDDDDDDDDD